MSVNSDDCKFFDDRTCPYFGTGETQPVSTPEPTDEELRLLAAEYRLLTAVQFARAVLARWGHPEQPEPVSVAERLPTVQDCDAEGCCWAYDCYGKWWQVHYRLVKGTGWSHWLPHWALPVPTPSTPAGLVSDVAALIADFASTSRVGDDFTPAAKQAILAVADWLDARGDRGTADALRREVGR